MNVLSFYLVCLISVIADPMLPYLPHKGRVGNRALSSRYSDVSYFGGATLVPKFEVAHIGPRSERRHNHRAFRLGTNVCHFRFGNQCDTTEITDVAVTGRQGAVAYFPFMRKPSLHVSQEHQAILLNNWAAVKPDMMTHGRNILLIFFKDYPQHIKYFPFKNLTIEEMGEDANFKNHGLRVVRELGSWLDFLNNEPALMVALKRNIQSHKKRNIERSAYNDLATAILKYLGETFGSSFTPEMRNVWQETLGKIFKVITDGACISTSH